MEDSSIETVVINGEESEPIIKVSNAYKRYSPTSVILQGLNMTVPKGAIYGLLGPSGCGKTTLLNSIAGRQSLDSGSIIVGLKSRSQLGYMPQELSLYDELDVVEIFMYFGRLFKKTDEYIKQREKELIEFLELPAPNRTLGSLSGGQQRRVSMAVALLHDPELLIMDEPTVGLDPLLCFNIWEYFLKITNEDKKTIIITTHYIEEAKNSHVIGLMRGGLILAEKSPTDLIASLNCSSLEEAFLILSERQENQNVNPSDSAKDYPQKSKNIEVPFSNEASFCCHRFSAQLLKNINWTKKNIPITLFMLLLPATLFTIFMWMLSGSLEHVKVATVREELVPGIDDCVVTQSHVSEYGCEVHARLSCYFVSYLKNKSYTVIEYNKRQDAIDAVKRNDVYGYIYFPKNYTEALLERLDKGRRASNETIENSYVQVYMDNTPYFIPLSLKANLGIAFFKSMEILLKQCEIHEKVIKSPINEQTPLYNTFGVRYAPLPGYIISVLFYLAYVYSSSALANEKCNGLVERAYVSGLTGFEMGAAHICIQTMIAILQIIIVFFFLFRGFNVDLTFYNISMSMALLLLITYCGMITGFIVVEYTTDNKFVTYTGVTIIITLFFSIGMIWPAEALYWPLKIINTLNPVKAAVETLQSIYIRKMNFSNPLVFRGYLYTILLFVLSTTYICIRMKRRMH